MITWTSTPRLSTQTRICWRYRYRGGIADKNRVTNRVLSSRLVTRSSSDFFPPTTRRRRVDSPVNTHSSTDVSHETVLLNFEISNSGGVDRPKLHCKSTVLEKSSVRILTLSPKVQVNAWWDEMTLFRRTRKKFAQIHNNFSSTVHPHGTSTVKHTYIIAYRTNTKTKSHKILSYDFLLIPNLWKIIGHYAMIYNLPPSRYICQFFPILSRSFSRFDKQ